MMSTAKKCKHCQTAIGGGEICVSCYAKRSRKCPVCMDANGKLQYRFKDHWRGGDVKRGEFCEKCKNTRWIYTEDAR